MNSKALERNFSCASCAIRLASKAKIECKEEDIGKAIFLKWESRQMLRFAETVISWYLRIVSSTNVEATGKFLASYFLGSHHHPRMQDGKTVTVKNVWFDLKVGTPQSHCAYGRDAKKEGVYSYLYYIGYNLKGTEQLRIISEPEHAPDFREIFKQKGLMERSSALLSKTP